ncbi:MAG: hypothetical protein RR201_01505 [Malacoplasma sp.]
MIDNRNEKLQTESITIKKNYKTWFRKKANIILMCSTIGIGIVATAISVPLVFLNKFDFVVPVSNVRLSEVKNVYNKKTNEVTLIIMGDNLSDNKDLYSIYNITNSRTNGEIPRADITIIPYSNTRIDIKFQDRFLNDLSIYQVLFNNGTSSGIKIESTSNENIAQPIILLNSKPLDTTLSNGQQRERLAIDVSVENKIRGIEPSYQWFSSDSQTGPYLPISNATSSTFTKNLDSNKNSLKDTWYKCEVTYTGATTPTVSSTPALVKMTLTEAEAKTELIKWFGEQNNFDPILRSYFNETNSTNNRQAFYSSLHIREFINVPTSVEVVSITPEQLSIQGAATFTSYKIKIKTNSTASYRNRTAGGTAPEEWLPIGTFIEFNTLFSFLGDSSAVKNVHGASNYNMSLTTSFSSSGNKNVTTISWTTNPNDVPGISNALRSNAYPVRVTNSNGGVIFTDSLVSSALPSFSSTYNPTIPTYNIRH